MQIGLRTTSSSASVSTRGGVYAPASIQARTISAVTSARTAYPESALISTWPLRYNVQFNQQITDVQLADSYLASAEKQLLQFRRAMDRGQLQQQGEQLVLLLDKRNKLSGGRVDRQFNVTLQSKTQVNFTVPGMEKVINNPGGETLVFMLGGSNKALAAVNLPEEASPAEVLMKMNTGLGRMGINALQGQNGHLSFNVDESGWQRVLHHFSVRGEGHNFVADSFTLLSPQPGADFQEVLKKLAARADNDRETQHCLKQALEQITTQRVKLRMQQDRVRVRIDDMATPYDSLQAKETAGALNMMMKKSGSSFSTLNRMLTAQANIQLATVKNLLA